MNRGYYEANRDRILAVNRTYKTRNKVTIDEKNQRRKEKVVI